MRFTQQELNKIWFTGDTHFGHTLMLTACNRSFKTILEHDEVLIKNWNNIVKKDDIIYHLGDVSHRCHPKRLKNILERLNGRKYLIIGNHDRKNLSVLEKYFQYIEKYEFIECEDDEANRGQQGIMLCHYAFEVWHKSHHGSWHLHAHSHSGLPSGNRLRWDVGVDRNQYIPIGYSQVKQIMKNIKRGIV